MVTWKRKRLAEVCTLQRGFDLPTKDRKPGDSPLVSSSGIADFIDQSKVRGPGVVTGRSGSIGNVFFVENDFWPLNTALYVKDFFGNDERFVFFLLQSLDLARFASGTGVPTLNRNHVSDEIVCVPDSIEEQRRIVAVLDEAFAAIATASANTEKNLANAQALFENTLSAAFANMASTTPERTIGEIATIKGGKRVPKGYKLLSETTPYPYLTVGDFTEDGTIDPSKVRFVSEDIRDQIKRYIIRTEDLYVSIAGTIGRTGIVPSEFDGAQLTENACRLIFKEGISNKFVYFFTKSAAFHRQAIEQTRTAAQPKLALNRLEQIKLPVPNLDAQKAMIERFSELQDLAAQLADLALKKLELLAALKQSLLHRAFAGDLTAAMPEAIAA
jgi:type I restriction enzyme S subunit